MLNWLGALSAPTFVPGLAQWNVKPITDPSRSFGMLKVRPSNVD